MSDPAVVISPNPGGPDDPLGESVAEAGAAPLRVFACRDLRLVIGRGQDPARELVLEQVSADGVPVHRRLSGGGTVVLAPGVVVVALRLPRRDAGVDEVFARVNAILIPVLSDLAGTRVETHGHGDLALAVGVARPRKILGASLRLRRDDAIYLGALLVDDLVPVMERYLRHPSREPAYRTGRNHRDFCTHLGTCQVTAPALVAALAAALPPLTAS